MGMTVRPPLQWEFPAPYSDRSPCPSPIEGEGFGDQNPLAMSGSGAVFSLRISRLLSALT